MAFNVKDLDFNVELSPKMSRGSSFPRENCCGISLLRPDVNKRTYRLKVMLSHETCRKAGITVGGFVLIRISNCSTAAQILYEKEQGEHFKGYALRPTGGYRNKEQIKAYIKQNGDEYMACFAELSVNFDELDNKKTNKFELEFVDILHVAKNQVVIDISKLRLNVKKG